ncbi:MAG: SDR family oxidoreductase [Dehalococcoidia bacterium]|nr:MAG: SDR family oxidoreductase [Dehalococcoidia bacterium]
MNPEHWFDWIVENHEFEAMKVLITGGSGFIGTNLVAFYLSREVEVSNLDIVAPRNSEHERYWKQVDLLDRERLQNEIHAFSPTHIFQLAARTDLDETSNINRYAANIQGVANLLAATKSLPSLERIIFASSLLVCKNGYQPRSETDYCPNTLYGESKVLTEKIVRGAEDIPYSWVIVRPTSIWGPWFGPPYKTLFRLIAKGIYVHPCSICINQSLGFVGNTVYQLHKLMEAPDEKVHHETFYLADYPPMNIRTWTNLIQKTLKAKRIREVPIWVLRILAILGDLAKLAGWKNPPLSSFRLNNLLTNSIYDLDPIVVGELPYTLEEAVQITVDWLYKNGEISHRENFTHTFQ